MVVSDKVEALERLKIRAELPQPDGQRGAQFRVTLEDGPVQGRRSFGISEPGEVSSLLPITTIAPRRAFRVSASGKCP